MTEAQLKTYRAKRDFKKTREPAGGAPSAEGLAFCVQKHDATRLHYDFRIEWEGVLKSWAVTRGPSLNPADKRLAVRTEDHPMDYGDFEGTIPKGEYGGGTVMLWDRGRWEPVGDARKGFADGNLKMELHGERLRGRWALIRMKPRDGEKGENWLLIKEKDDEASPRRDILKELRSVKTGRTMAAIAADAPAEQPAEHSAEDTTEPGAKPAGRKRRTAAKGSAGLPAFREVQLATLVDAPPPGEDVLHEVKYDGYRVLIARADDDVRLYTRSGLDWTQRFRSLIPAIKALPARRFLIDGEVVAYDDTGRTDFSALQAALGDGGQLDCFCFDLLELEAEDVTGLPLIERKARLEGLMSRTAGSQLHYSPHVVGHGAQVLQELCSKGMEGVVSKRADAPYLPGRSKSWLKAKCSLRQEFVIGGFATSDKAGRAFASILVGAYDGDRLVYKGRVGSGFDEKMLVDLSDRFAKLSVARAPFDSVPRAIARTARYVRPELIAEIEFAELTREGHVRHGVFKGLREDKEADTVVEEKPDDAPAPRTRRKSRGDGKPVDICGVRLTSPDRVLFAEQGVTKKDLAQYYERVAPLMLPYAGGRPVSLVRCPQGDERHCFFQKHDTGGFPDAMGKVELSEKDGGRATYLSIDDAASLVAGVQMGTMEFHIWGARNDDVEKPDRLVFDLDPDEGLGFAAVRQAAKDLAERLDGLGLRSLVLLTGGKGVHLVLPLQRRQGWDETKAFARGFAQSIAEDAPDRFVATMSKARRKGRIFIDWLRNERGSTAIAPYSTRSRSGGPVATPITWEELDTVSGANHFTVPDMAVRLAGPDPWADYAGIRQSITRKALSAVT